MSNVDPFGTPESEAWLRAHANEGRRQPYDPERMAANDRAERRLRLAEERAERQRSGASGPTRSRRRSSSSSRSSAGRLPTVQAQDAERTLAWQLVVFWALQLANDLAPGPTGRGGTARGQALPKPRQFLAAALVWIALSFPGQAKDPQIRHAAVLLGWLVVLSYAMLLLRNNPSIFQWISNIAGSPSDLFPPRKQTSWNAETLGYSGGLTPAQAAAQVPAAAAALQQDYGMSAAQAQAYASQLSQSLQYPYSG